MFAIFNTPDRWATGTLQRYSLWCIGHNDFCLLYTSGGEEGGVALGGGGFDFVFVFIGIDGGSEGWDSVAGEIMWRGGD